MMMGRARMRAAADASLDARRLARRRRERASERARGGDEFSSHGGRARESDAPSFGAFSSSARAR